MWYHIVVEVYQHFSIIRLCDMMMEAATEICLYTNAWCHRYSLQEQLLHTTSSHRLMISHTRTGSSLVWTCPLTLDATLLYCLDQCHNYGYNRLEVHITCLPKWGGTSLCSDIYCNLKRECSSILYTFTVKNDGIVPMLNAIQRQGPTV